MLGDASSFLRMTSVMTQVGVSHGCAYITMTMLTSHASMVVECRRRLRVHGVERNAPSSGDTFWELELMDEPYSGQYAL